jgi:hypothetical protein
MLAVEFVWADVNGGVHGTAREDVLKQMRRRFDRLPDRLVLTLDTTERGREVLGYLPPTADGLRAAFALPQAVAALEEAEAPLAAHAGAATCTADEQTLATVRSALAACRGESPVITGGP